MVTVTFPSVVQNMISYSAERSFLYFLRIHGISSSCCDDSRTNCVFSEKIFKLRNGYDIIGTTKQNWIK